MSEKTALVILVDGVEELEATAPIDLLRRAGVMVRVTAAGDSQRVEGRNGIVLEADSLLERVGSDSSDLVVIPGGPGHTTLRDNPQVLEILQHQHARKGWIGSICAGPVVLDKAGVLDGKQFTSFPGTRDILPGRDPDKPVVTDGNIITSQGAGTAILFALELVRCLCGTETRDAIAASICHPG